MPLVVICGPPCCGKTTLATELASALQERNVFPTGVSVVSDEQCYSVIGQSRNNVYSNSTNEKQMRAKLKDDVTRILTNQRLVILDAQNYIKGFRYELFYVVKAAKTTQCVLHINCDVTFCLEINSKKELYSEETIRALCQRFETPQSNARWDWPLVQLTPFEPIDVDRVQQLLTNRTALVPNLSTQNPPRLASEALYDLDKITQALTVQVFDKVSKAEVGDTVVIECGVSSEGAHSSQSGRPPLGEKLVVSRSVTMPELQRIRRHFLSFYKTHTFKDASHIPSVFLQFVSNSML